MFESLRKHNKVLMAVLILLIVPSFVLVGVQGYNTMRDQDPTAARVGNVKITQAEWNVAHQREVERLRQMMPGVDIAMFDSPAVRYNVLERLLRERVLQEAAQRSRLQVSDARLARELQSIPAIAQLRRGDGTLDVTAYRDLLARQGLTPEMFEAQMRAGLATAQMQAGVAQTGVTATTAADLALGAWLERREVQIARFAATDYTAQVQPTDAEIEAFYQANAGLFQAEEKAQIEYLVLDIEALRREVRVSESDLREYYAQNAERYSEPEERRASHILIAASVDASVADREKAKARAQQLLAEAKAAPGKFAELAKKHSQDPGSAARGGDLDWFTRGAMVKPFEDAVFALEQGQISEVVESDFGYHIIQLTGIKKPKAKSLAELRATLEDEIKTQQARARYAEAAEIFTNGVYEQSDSLKPVAERLHLTVQTASVGRRPAPGAQGALASTKFLEAVFGEDAIRNQRNTEAVEIAPSQLASARIVKYQPAHTLPLAEVRATVRERVVLARAAELARADGMKRLDEWKAAPAQARLGRAQIVARTEARELDPALLEAILRADAAQLPQWVGVDLGPQGYAVARVNKRMERPDTAADAQRQQRSQYLQSWTQAEDGAYERWLAQRFKAKIEAPRPTQAAPV